MLNLLSLCFSHYGQPASWSDTMDAFNYLFTSIYTLEAIIKLIAFHGGYFKSLWNCFDFTVVSISWLDIIFVLVGIGNVISPGIIRALRILRVVRVLRLIRYFKGIRKLFVTLAFSLPSMMNIAGIVFIFIFIFANIGMALFGNVIDNDIFNEVINFRTFGPSFLLMFRLATGAGWNDLIDALSVAPPYCDPTYNELPNGNCGSYANACIFMCLYVLIVPVTIMNMYVAIVLDNFQQATNQDENDFDEVDFEQFYEQWATYDKKAIEFISYKQAISLIQTLKGKLAIEKVTPKIIESLHIPLYDGQLVHCIDLLHELIRYHRAQRGLFKDEERSPIVLRTIQASFRKSFPVLTKVQTTSSVSQRQIEDRAAALIQQKFREFVSRRLRKRRDRRVQRSGSLCQADYLEFIDLAMSEHVPMVHTKHHSSEL